MRELLHLTECPRDAMQGMKNFIPTAEKTNYLNQLLSIGYDRLDFGSFVSPKAIPQLRDTKEVLQGLDLSSTKTKLLAIIANKMGAQNAILHEEISYLGFPFSISETFQLRNTNATREQALDRIKEIQEISVRKNKNLLIYLSMGFGNPYGDPWSPEIVAEWADKIKSLGIQHFSIADTIGNSNPDLIKKIYPLLTDTFPDVEWGLHLHSTPDRTYEKISTAFELGCRRLDAAIRGFGGCPMAKDDLVGNLPTEDILHIAKEFNLDHQLDTLAFDKAFQTSASIFKDY